MAKKMQMEMSQIVAQRKEDIDKQGAFAAYGLMAIKGAKSPAEAQQISNAIIQEAVSKKYVSPEEAKSFMQAPLSMKMNMLGAKVMQYGMAAEYKAMNPEKPQAGSNVEFYEGGGLKSISQDIAGSTKNKVAGELIDKQVLLQQLGEVRSKFNPELHTYAGQAGVKSAAIAEKSKGIPGLEQASEFVAKKITGLPAAERGDGLREATEYLNGIEQYFNTYRKEITGAAAAEKELNRLRESTLNGDMSPSQALGAMDQLMMKISGETEFKKNVLRKGIDTTPGDARRQHLLGKGYSVEEVDNYLKGAK
jgi:hypothetical protein